MASRFNSSISKRTISESCSRRSLDSVFHSPCEWTALARRAGLPIELHCETNESHRADRAQLLMLTLATARGDSINPEIRDALLLYLGDGTEPPATRQAEAW